MWSKARQLDCGCGGPNWDVVLGFSVKLRCGPRMEGQTEGVVLEWRVRRRVWSKART